MKRRLLLHVLIAVLCAIPLAAGGESLYKTLKPILRPKKIKPGGSKIELDESGVPWVDYGGDLGRQRNAVTTAQEALKHWDRWKAGEEKRRKPFFNCADWLVENAVRRDGIALYEYTFDWPMYRMKAPWKSGLAQGEALKALSRAHAATGEERYLKTAREVMKAFFVEVEDGGVTYKSETDGWWYEEAAAKGARVSRVLNGMMGAVLGIHEYHVHSKDPEAKVLFDRGIIALKASLPDYDCLEKWTSYYDILGDPAGRGYHEYHIGQLTELYDITREPIFLEYRDLWQGYISDSFFVLLFREPTGRRIRSVLVSLAFLFGVLEGVSWVRRRRRARRPA